MNDLTASERLKTAIDNQELALNRMNTALETFTSALSEQRTEVEKLWLTTKAFSQTASTIRTTYVTVKDSLARIKLIEAGYGSGMAMDILDQPPVIDFANDED